MQYNCEYCHKEFKNQNAVIGHLGHCKFKFKFYKRCNCKKIFYDEILYNQHKIECTFISKKKLKLPFECKYCHNFFPRSRKNAGHQTMCSKNPNKQITIDKLTNLSTGRKHSEKTKKFLSENKLQYLKNNPDKVPYLLNHSSKESYPEKIFREELVKQNILGWEQKFRNSIYEYDFAFPDLKIDVEIDGSTHLSEKVKKIDKRRDEFSKSQGWIVIRFEAKLVTKNLLKCIEELKKILVPSMGLEPT